MASDNRLELVVEVATGAANAAIKGINDGLGVFERVAVAAAEAAAKGFEKFELAAARLTKAFASNVKQFIQDPLGAAGNMVESLISKMGPLGTAAFGLAGAFTAVFVAGSSMAHQLGEAATQLYNASVRMGTSINDTKQLSVAAKMAGGELTDFESAMKMLSKGMAENSEKGKEARKVLQEWGISAKADTMTVLEQVSERLAGMKNHWEQANAAQQIFGRSGLTLLPVILDLAKNLKAVKEAGIGMTEESNTWARELHEQTVLADEKLEKIKKTYFMKPLAAVWSVTVDFIGTVSPKLMAIVDALGKVGATGAALGTAGFGGWQHLKDVMGGIWSPTSAPVKPEEKAARMPAGEGIHGPSEEENAFASYLDSILKKEVSALWAPLVEADMALTKMGATAAQRSKAMGIIGTEWVNKNMPNAGRTSAISVLYGAQAGLSDYDTGQALGYTSPGVTSVDVDPSILAGNAKAARDFALKGASMAAKGGGTDAQLALIARRKELGVDQLSLAEETAQVQIDAETKLRQMQQDRLTALRDGFNQVFDSIMAGGKGLMNTLMNLFKAAAITPIRNAFSSAFANMLAPAGGGGGGGGAGGGGGGLLLSGLGLGSGFGVLGTGGMTGATPPFWGGPDGYGAGVGSDGVFRNTMGAGGAGGGGGMLSGLGQVGMLGGLKQSLTNLGNIGSKFSLAHGGVNGLGGAALLAGGGMLAMDGWKRGGGLGMLEMAGGGGAIGWKFGGPIGAAIGAGVGALVGGLHWAFGAGSPEDQMKGAVKSAYALSIDTAYAKSLVQRAGGIDARVFVQRADIRDELMLYARMTRQGIGSGLAQDTTARGVNLQESGSTLYQAATYSGGGAYGYQSTLASTGAFTTLAPNVNVSFSLDGRATTAALGGSVVATTSQSQGRTALNANINSPLAVMV